MKDYSKEDDDLLRALWLVVPVISTSDIGRRMGRSKNSIVGRAHRLNLPPRPSPIRRRADGHVSKPKRPLRLQPGAATLPDLAGVPDYPVRFRAVAERPRYATRQQPCRWPIGEPGTPSFHFCDAGAAAGRSYCDQHDAIAYVRVRDQR